MDAQKNTASMVFLIESNESWQRRLRIQLTIILI